jgi:hypothetical protein
MVAVRFTSDENGSQMVDKRSRRGPFIGERRGKLGRSGRRWHMGAQQGCVGHTHVL